MTSRTRKILELAAESLEANKACLTEKIVESIPEDQTFESDVEFGCFVVNENGTLIPLYSDNEVVVDDSNLSSDSLGNISFPLDVSQALTAVEELTCNLHSIDHNLGTDDTPNVIASGVLNNRDQLPEPTVKSINNLNENEIELYEIIENDEENVIETNQPNTGKKGQEILQKDNSTLEVNDQLSKRKRRKRHQVHEDYWQCKQAKILREQGKVYKGRKASDGKVTGYVSRPERSMKPMNCKCKGKTFQCHTLTEPERKRIFQSFWTLTWKERKMLVRTSTDINLTQRARDRKEETKSRRSFSFKFYLYNINKITKVRVCKKTLLATLGLGEWMVNNWLEESKEKQNDDESGDLIEEPELNESSEHQKSSKRISRQLDLNNRLKLLKEFLLALPNVESHYCRASSTKLYLEPKWISKAQLFQFYEENWSKENNSKPLSSCTFHKTFEDLNLALYRPKKDQCDICRAHKLNHISDEDFKTHTEKKDEAREEKSKDKSNEEHVYTIDLQSLLLSPKSNASALYYRRKLSVHNLTVFDLKTQDGYCYLWNETEGELSANEFASIVTYFIESQLPLRNNAKKIIIFSDGCNYQNRSAVMSNALLHLALKHRIIIESKYLEKGHTQMECDSMHANIERYLKPREIHVPADFIEACKNARRNRPYKVEYLEHSFFKDFSRPMLIKSIRPGSKKGDAKVTDIRCLKYSKDGNIYYKLSFKDEFNLLPAFENAKAKERGPRKSMRKSKDERKSSTDWHCKTQELLEASFRPLHSERLKITEAKYKHLQELKLSIPKDYHSFYDDLPYL